MGEAVTRTEQRMEFCRGRNHAWKIAEKPKLRTEELRNEKSQKRKEEDRCKNKTGLTTKYDRPAQSIPSDNYLEVSLILYLPLFISNRNFYRLVIFATVQPPPPPRHLRKIYCQKRGMSHYKSL